MSDDDLEQEPQRQLSPVGLYSHASEVADRFPQMKGTPQQFKAMLMKQGVKPDELKWSGYDQKFAGRPLITKQELAQHFRESMPKVQETVLGGSPSARLERYTAPPKFGQYTLPGGQNYREVLMHLDKQPTEDEIVARYRHILVDRYPGMNSSDLAQVERSALRQSAENDLRTHADEQGYRSSHWDQPNVLAHLRMSDRKGPKGEKLLHLEELQSDWAQEGRKKGFKATPEEEADIKKRYTVDPLGTTDEYNARINDAHIPRAPYVDSTQKWLDLGLKRLLHEAARGGYHKIVVTPGEEQAQRYDLSKHVRELAYYPAHQMLMVLPHNSQKEERIAAPPDKLADHIGKEYAERLLSTKLKQDIGPGGAPYHELKGLDLRMGGEGMKAFYDKMLPQALEKLAKKHDPEAKVMLHGHDFKKGPVANPWHVVDPHDGESIERFATEQSARNWATDQAQRNYGVPMERMYRIEHRGRKGEARVNHGHALAITPKMRASILKGQPAYAAGGAVPDMADMMGHNGGPPLDTEHPARIPTRLVTSKKNPSKPTDNVDMPSFRSTPELYKKNVDLVRDYPNMRENVAKNPNHDVVAREFVKHVKDNLLDLHDRVPEHIRNRSKLWYDGARAITDKWSAKYGLPDHSVAGALAALSPQKDWYQNVSLAKRVLDRMRGDPEAYANHKFSPEMEATWKGRPSLDRPEYHTIVGMLRGKSLRDLDQLGLPPHERAIAKAMWIRMHDETHGNPAHPVITPEGGVSDFVRTDKGAYAKVGWGSLNEIAKAVRAIEEAHNPAALSQLMGERHKVRNFYNNILVPRSRHGDVTIDTHAVAAGLMRALSGNSLEVSHNFANHPGKGLPAAGGSALTGVQGLYPLYAEAYRQAAKARGILPREMQSITWEAIRGLFPDTFKTKANNVLVDDVWKEYRKGRLTQAQARNRIHELAGGIRPPTWFIGPDEAHGSTPDAGALSEPALHGQSTGTPKPRGRGRTTAAIPAEGLTAAPKAAIRQNPVTSQIVNQALQMAAKMRPAHE